MADEFVKGLGALTGAGFVWMVIAGWFYTPSFDGPQLTGAPPQNPSTFEQAALLLGDAMAVVAVGGALTFWVVIPAVREARDRWASS